jgi:2-polyprenyl-3-methyl-5-hydroxy-6-metoxy-1,4-benzoquinol methylase
MNYYDNKEKDYFTGTRLDVISLLPNNPNQKILEIGAGGGDTITYIKKNKLAKEVVGFELFEIPNSNQLNPEIDRFIFGNIESSDILEEENYFDVIILADVLEHLLDPWNVFLKVKKYLKKDGVILVSLPNVREINTLLKIAILGDFRYNEGGVLDKTHLRFFCKKNMMKMLNTEHTHIISSHPSFKFNKDQWKRKLYNSFSFGLFEEFLTFQYLFLVKNK